MRTKAQLFKVVAVAGTLMAGVLTANSAPVSAAAVDTAVNQAACTDGTGSATPRWGFGGLAAITPPVVSAMSINGESVPLGQIKSPTDHHLGVAICPGFDNARIVGLGVFQQVGSGQQGNLAGALLPSGAAYNANMTISLTISSFGTQAQYFSYPIIHGTVSNYVTANLGTPSASLQIDMKAVRLPILDFSQPGASMCTATPPICTATQSGLDITAASMAINMDPASPSRVFDGSYFAVVSATGGFVSPTTLSDGSRGIQATLGSSHFLSDGTTPNVGSMQAYLPNALLTNLLGLDDTASIDASDINVDRTDAGATGDATFGITPVSGGAILSVTGITFSTPVYNISASASASTGGGGSGDSSGKGGYRLYAADGGVFNYGHATSFGSAASLKLAQPIVGGASTTSSNGYWEVASDGGVFAYGDAKYYGSANTLKLAKPIIGLARTPDDHGYWQVAADGGVFAYGNAKYFGSANTLKLAKPIVAVVGSPSGNGYWEVASDGGVFAYGDVSYFGGLGGTKLNSPIVGAASTSSGQGYWLVAADGGVFAYGDAKFYGSLGATKLNSPVTDIAASPTDLGYTLTAADGGVFAYGDTTFVGSASALKLAKPVIGIS